MRVVAIIQARMGSRRLPGKALILIQGRTVLEHVIERVRRIKRIDAMVIATSVKKENDAIERKAKAIGVPCYRGSEEDVLDRFVRTAQVYNADHIVRITADCVLLDPQVVDEIIELHLREGYDYTSNILKRTYPRGIVAEVFTQETLHKIATCAVNTYHREHVTTYLRDHPEEFRVGNLEAPSGHFNSEWRWVLDTKDDLNFVKEVYSLLGTKGKIFGCEPIVHLMHTHFTHQKNSQAIAAPKG